MPPHLDDAGDVVRRQRRVVKAFTSFVSGKLARQWGSKRVLVLGWRFGLPLPFLILWALSWNWIIAANALLGVSQGFARSMTPLMKVDLVGPTGRGLAVGLNEFAGYFAVGTTAFLKGYLASLYSSKASSAATRNKEEVTRALTPA